MYNGIASVEYWIVEQSIEQGCRTAVVIRVGKGKDNSHHIKTDWISPTLKLP